MTNQKQPDISTPPVDDKDAERIEDYGHGTNGEPDSPNKKTS